MAQLVSVGNGESQLFCQCWILTSVKIRFIVSDAANILHGASNMLWDEDLIVLAEGIDSTEEFLIEGDPALSGREHILVLDVSEEGFPGVNPHERHTFGLTFVKSECTGSKRIEVGRYLE